MITVRKSHQRGTAHLGWLDSQHTFSFGHYYDSQQMGFSVLRVLNDDRVKPGAGFDTHGHQDMEIISLVLQGTIEHQDSEGNIKTLPAGEFQLMSAGKGIRHSEYNRSDHEPLRFLQIWIQPEMVGGSPNYQQKDFGQQTGLTTIITPDGAHGTLQIKQDVKMHQLIVPAGESLQLAITEGRRVYVHQISQSLQLNQTLLESGDGAKVDNLLNVTFTNMGASNAKALVFDLP
ncbi:pirin family protein [Vibrio ostreicida]|uniref:Pirin family protein n=1 Tax=Vibrio ostreicida TaxID=526588 RepID=A0ABT8BY17_9VIBR|nr:pirin family protein [Vibrio ostreicida]MDN3611548.1 pirin family protein [Vibrio ostreicida]NPD09041.1 pirin family protein [Vibrio ostreicida]